MSYGPIRAQHSPSSRHNENDRSLTFFRARTLSFVLTLASQDALQRVFIVLNVSLLLSSPSLKQSDERTSYLVNV